ncbi:MAG: 50S ribosomal protein L21 [Parachlamydiaceae bacterium]|nr:50S ribosomal protein L21 [Parachlamydiaceae bacterium]
MYAIIKSGGKQYKVAEGDTVDVELLEGELGSQINLTDILFVNDGSQSIIGAPFITDYSIIAELVDYVAGPKVTCVKYIPGNHRRKIGHRQHYSRLKITGIQKKGHQHGS